MPPNTTCIRIQNTESPIADPPSGSPHPLSVTVHTTEELLAAPDALESGPLWTLFAASWILVSLKQKANWNTPLDLRDRPRGRRRRRRLRRVGTLRSLNTAPFRALTETPTYVRDWPGLADVDDYDDANNNYQDQDRFVDLKHNAPPVTLAAPTESLLSVGTDVRDWPGLADVDDDDSNAYQENDRCVGFNENRRPAPLVSVAVAAEALPSVAPWGELLGLVSLGEGYRGRCLPCPRLFFFIGGKV
ncbi:hypothetical protein BDK51DRAFT_47282 [Blyttiomyces helicus]|uniref:Uncharacterized protein n=1 Tax=Blyttiomyces helicus TaxID=388810 RepID=A0A4P9WE32_9FUNG|nr:hypothetical protein BDK51DRAFT_47282 [Blyttiomyces helicus]|eukprot:RKO90015.1 hypothetical protein BDK51DRAFT_47282 [Blyttiomyces helicus]